MRFQIFALEGDQQDGSSVNLPAFQRKIRTLITGELTNPKPRGPLFPGHPMS